MKSESIEPDWRTILTHEAGHAVAALVLYDEVADILLRCSVSGGPANRASYNLRDVEDGFVPNPRPPLQRIMVCAAGAKAEEVLLGIAQSMGFDSDNRKIERVRDRLGREANVEHLLSLGLPSEILSEALAKVPDAQTKLALVEREISSNFSGTAELIARYRNEVELIAVTAIGRLREVDQVDGAILLPASQVRSLWIECQRVTNKS